MKKIQLLILFLFPILFYSCNRPQKKPNIIIILADDLGYGDLSVYNGWVKTPNIEQLAAEGMMFTDFHSNGAVCSPTRAALLTGRYQQRSGIDDVVYANPKANRHHGLFPDKEITFSELFKNEGYATAVFGKWHLGYERKYNPTHHKFDEFVGYVSGNVDYFSHVDGMGFYDWYHNLDTVIEEGYVTHLVTDHAVRFVEENKNKPFCMYVAHEAPHFPFQGPNDKAIRKIGKRIRENRRDTLRVRNTYREMVEELDKSVGEILKTVKKNGLDKNTFIFFCSDNGALQFGSNGELRGYKGRLWEGGHRVPAIAWWPDKVEAGSKHSGLHVGMDVMPTIMEICGIEKPEARKLDGESFYSLLFAEESQNERQVFWEYNDQQAMRDGDWKLILTHQKDSTIVELFDLKNDIKEKNNLVLKQPERVNTMKIAIAEWKNDVMEGATVQPDKH